MASAAVVPASIPGGIASLKTGLSLTRAGSQRSMKGLSLSLVVSPLASARNSLDASKEQDSSPIFTELASMQVDTRSSELSHPQRPPDMAAVARYMGFVRDDEDAPERVQTAAGAKGQVTDDVKAAASKGRGKARFKNNVKKVTQIMGVVNQMNEAIRAHSFASNELEAAAKAARRSILTETSKRMLVAATPLKRQGDASLYNRQSMVIRKSLREDPDVVAQLAAFWQLVPREKTTSTADGEGVKKVEYFRLIFAIRAALGESDDDAEVEDLEREWRADAKGAATMGRERFYDSIYELCDIWCKTTKKSEYLQFLREKHAAVAARLPTQKLPERVRVHFGFSWGQGAASLNTSKQAGSTLSSSNSFMGAVKCVLASIRRGGGGGGGGGMRRSGSATSISEVAAIHPEPEQETSTAAAVCRGVTRARMSEPGCRTARGTFTTGGGVKSRTSSKIHPAAGKQGGGGGGCSSARTARRSIPDGLLRTFNMSGTSKVQGISEGEGIGDDDCAEQSNASGAGAVLSMRYRGA